MSFEELLVGRYDAETLARYEDTHATVSRSYPTMLWRLLEGYGESVQFEEYAAAFKLFLDFFEVSIQFVSAILLQEIRCRDGGCDELRKPVESLSGPQLSTGKWFEIYRQIAKVGARQDIELAAAFERKASGRKNRFLSSFLKIPSFRNNYAHDTTTTDAQAERQLRELEPCLFEFVETLAELAGYVLITREKQLSSEGGRHAYKVRVQMQPGPFAHRLVTGATLSDDGVYFVRRTVFDEARKTKGPIEEGDIVSLPPLVVHALPALPEDRRGEDPSQGRRTYIFQTWQPQKRIVSYITPEDCPRKDTDAYAEAFQRFIASILGGEVLTKRQPLPRPALTWERARSAAVNETRNFIGSMSSKYDRSLFVPRREMWGALRSFLEESDRTGFVLLGSSGAGKTNLLCWLAEELLSDDDTCVLTYYGKWFANRDLAERVAESFSTAGLPFDELIDRLAELTQEGSRRVVVLFDAINECVASGGHTRRGYSAPTELIRRIDRLLVSRRLPGFKVVLSCRNYTWEEARRSQGHGVDPELYFTSRDLSGRDGGTSELELKGFTDEELAEAYPRYARSYDLQTPYAALEKRPFLRRQLRDPLRLRLAAECFRGRELPDQRVDSLKLMERQHQTLAEALGGADGVHQSNLLTVFTELLWGRRADALPFVELQLAESVPSDDASHGVDPADTFLDQRQKVRLLRAGFLDDDGGFQPALKRLIDGGVLRIEEGTTYPELRFVYERFHEFLLGRSIVAVVRKLDDPEAARFIEHELERAREYAVAWGAIRNALVLHWRETDDPELLRRLAGGTAYGAQGMVVEVVTEMAQEDYEAAFAVLGQLIETPTALRPKAERLAAVDEQLRKLRSKLRRRDAKRKASREEQAAALEDERAALVEALRPLVRIKKAAVKTLYDIYRSANYREDLYREPDPLTLLWLVLADPLEVVRDDATRHVYYLWTERRETANEILERLAAAYQEKGLFERYGKRARQAWLEPCGRLSGLVLAETLLHGETDGELARLKELWQQILRRIMLGGAAKPLVIPLVRRILTNAGKAISAYVNNVVEYQHFYDEGGVPATGDGYTRETFARLIPFLDPDAPGFDAVKDDVVAGAALGDALNNFLLERVLIAQGVRGYDRIADVVDRIYHNEANALPAYTQMSMLYVVFHTLDKMEAVPEEPFERYQAYMRPWTEQTRGWFQAHYNDVANEGRPYKQYTLNWYGALHSKLYGDGERMALFEEYLETAFRERDLALFRYVVDNIAMLAADFGYWRSALRAFEHTLSLFRTERDLRRFRVEPKGEGEGPGEVFDVRAYLARSLATIRGYFGAEVDRFVADELASLRFPGADRFREDLLRFEASESIGDLLTHKFGNLWVQGIVSIPRVREEVRHVLGLVPGEEDVQSWLTAVARHSLALFFDL